MTPRQRPETAIRMTMFSVLKVPLKLVLRQRFTLGDEQPLE